MEEKKYVVNLSETLPKEFLVAIAGRKEGRRQRRIWKLDKLEKKYDKIDINIDPKFQFMSISFIQGMFSKSVKKLGKVDFYDKYTFNCSEHIKKEIANEMMFMDEDIVQKKKK